MSHLSQQDDMVQKNKHMEHRTVNNSSSKTDKVMEPLTRLFAYFVDQLKLMTTSVHSTHNGLPNYEENGRHGHKQMVLHNGHRQNGNNNYHGQDNAQWNHRMDHCHQTSFTQNGHHRTIGMV